jgi:colanic acid biosynthesis glycosyl transferase WcaI
MKILFLTSNFYPEKTGISVIATDCARFISEFGHEVTVVSAMPYYPEWRIHKDYRGKVLALEEYHGMKLQRVWLYVPPRPSAMKRILHELSLSVLVFLRAIFHRCDLLLCISPPLTLGLIATILSLLRRKPLWLYVMDIQPDAAVELGMIRNPVVIRLLSRMEKLIYWRSSKILLLSEGMVRNLKMKGVAEDKLSVLPYSVDVHEFQNNGISENLFREANGLDSKFIVMYSGNLGVKQNPTTIVECARELAHDDEIFFVLVGEGAMKEAVLRLIHQYRLKNIRLLPLCEREQLGSLLGSADVLLAPQRREVVDIVLPSKLLSYFASGKPVLACAHAESDTAKLLRSSGAGLLVEPDDVKAMVEGILFLKNHPVQAAEIGRRGYEFLVREYDQRVVKERYYRPLFSRDFYKKPSERRGSHHLG